jgi:peroxiredoxin
MFADSDGSFTKFLGMDTDLTAGGLGVRSKRYAMLVDNGKVVFEGIESKPGE